MRIFFLKEAKFSPRMKKMYQRGECLPLKENIFQNERKFSS
jgi:hypothetical protein